MIAKVKEWSLIEQQPEQGSKRPGMSVIVADSDISSKAFQIRVPYSPVIDTTISPQTYDLFIDNSDLHVIPGKVVKTNAFFREKSGMDEGMKPATSSFPNTPIGMLSSNTVSDRRRGIVDESGTGVTVSAKAAALGAPGKEILAGEGGVTMMGGSPTIPDFPSTDHVLLKETGIGRLMPRCFVPPFCMPAFLPSLQFIAQVAGTIGILKEIEKMTKTGL